jgi:hypothetical protein
MHRVHQNGRASHARTGVVQLACAAALLVLTSIGLSHAVGLALGATVVFEDNATSTVIQQPMEAIRMAGRPF